ncbi:hypothetical protein FZEAL_1538 [Fusarium zealandicum]|uniref:Uncharacterized protein n=1 Tax=Fusarium zealandicum TaxID=1053134 RepID=A0A8H4USL2_9HYPO|nr:hypothetical protein FZEAL_1538 [Fusarium zealandicum]
MNQDPAENLDEAPDHAKIDRKHTKIQSLEWRLAEAEQSTAEDHALIDSLYEELWARNATIKTMDEENNKLKAELKAAQELIAKTTADLDLLESLLKHAVVPGSRDTGTRRRAVSTDEAQDKLASASAISAWKLAMSDYESTVETAVSCCSESKVQHDG